MSTMIERVANSIFDSIWPTQTWEMDESVCWAVATAASRSAVEAMREPTDGMIGAATKDTEYGALRYEVPNEEISRIFTAMINAALEETQ